MEGHKSWQAKNIPKRADCKGNKKKSSTWRPPPPIVKSILNKKRGGTIEKMFSLDKPSPIITIHLEIKVVYARYNAINTIYR